MTVMLAAVVGSMLLAWATGYVLGYKVMMIKRAFYAA